MLDFPLLILAPGFYKLDFSELPVLLCGFYLGPSATVVCEAVKILLKLLLKSTSTAFVGDLANFVVGCSFVLPATFWYHLHKSRHSAVIGLTLGTISMTIFGSAFNAIYLLPKFSQLYGLPLEQIIAMGTQIWGGVHNVTTLPAAQVLPALWPASGADHCYGHANLGRRAQCDHHCHALRGPAEPGQGCRGVGADHAAV